MHEADDVTFDTQLEDAPRCLDCAYCLIGLTQPRCPECGRPFDLTDPSTYSTKPPFVRWRLWLPGLLLAVGLGLVVFLVIIVSGLRIGFAATLAAPVCIGIVLGYRCRVRPLAYVLLVLTALTGIFVALFSLRVTGLFCSVIAFSVAFGPMLAGAFAGMLLRWRLKKSGFSQRSYLPLLLMFFLPVFLALAEKLVGFESVRTSVQTSRVLRVPMHRAWQSTRYFEELEGEPPLLFRLGGPQPVGTDGSLTQSGDIQVCKYRNGWVTKKLRTKEYGRAIVFDVIEQEIGFERSVRLLSGSFRFETLGATTTRLTLRTDYEALLRPRVCWAPFEHHVLRTLHDYILDGIERQASAYAHLSSTPLALTYDSP